MAEIGVLIPVYLAEKYLERCLNSLIRQSFTSWEAILINDGSIDNSISIMLDYAKKDTRFRVIKISHTGLSEVRNLLITENKNDYFFFLDADDFLAPEALEILYRTAITYDADIVQCRMDHRTEKDEITDQTDEGITVYTREEALRAYNRTINGPRCMSAGKLYHKDVFKGIEYPHDGRTNEDEYVAFRLIDQCKRFVIVQRKLYAYWFNRNSIMRGPFNISHYDVLPAIIDSIYFYRQKGILSQVYRIEFRYLIVIQGLYQNTMKSFPEETERLVKLKEEYSRVLPDVIDNLELPSDVREPLIAWEKDPMGVKTHGYWYYVANELLPE
jgi:glycosyltransferase involved in cell wall biosynthesis